MPSSLAATTTKGQPSNFDRLSFVRYMKNIGRAYRKQAMELVSLCRTFVQAEEQSPGPDSKLRTALKAVDDALGSAAEVKKRPSKVVDEKIATAVEVLSWYETHYHNWHARTVRERMAAAKAKDKCASKMLNVLKEKLCRKVTNDRQSETTTVVDFHLFKSLPDENPTIVQQVLGQGSNLQEVLWNFSHFKGEKRLTLLQNPHFYKYSDLPKSQKAYVDDFNVDPIDDFHHDKICVLTDKPGRVFLGTDKSMRAFGNLWKPDKAFIFKDVCGKLEGEGVVQKSIQGSSNHLWHLGEPLLPPTTSLPASPGRLAFSVTAFTTNSLFQDWRDPIRQGLIPPETDICIRARPPSNSIFSPPSPSSPIASADSSANDGGLPPKLQIVTQATSLRSARHTAVPRRSLTLPGTPGPPSPSVWSIMRPEQPPMVAVPLTNQATLAHAASLELASSGVSQKRRGSQGSIARGQGDVCGPAKKGTASGSEAAGTPSQTRGMPLSQSSFWQFWNRRYNQAS